MPMEEKTSWIHEKGVVGLSLASDIYRPQIEFISSAVARTRWPSFMRCR